MIGKALFLAEHSRPDILQTIMLMGNPSFGVINHGNGVQILDIQDAYLLNSGSTLYIPVQEQTISDIDRHYNMPELISGT